MPFQMKCKGRCGQLHPYEELFLGKCLRCWAAIAIRAKKKLRKVLGKQRPYAKKNQPAKK